MAVTINADTTNGLVMTPDTSGEIKLQSAGAEIASVTANGIDVTGDFTVDTTTLHVDATNNRVGIGTSSPTTELDVSGTVQSQNNAASNDSVVGAYKFYNTNASASANPIRASIVGGRENSAWGAYLQFNTSTGTSAQAERMRIDSSGNVLVGTTVNRASTATPRMIIDTGNNGNTSIKTMPCGLAITNSHNANATGYGASIKMHLSSDGEVGKYAAMSVYASRTYANGTGLRFWTNPTGENGADNTAQRMQIDHSGSIGAGGSSTNIYNASDSRLKKDVQPLSNATNIINSLNPVSFKWIDGFTPDEQNKTLYGFVAQEVQQVDTNLIESFGNNSVFLEQENSEDLLEIENPLRVNEKFIIPLLTKALQEAITKIEDLETRIQTLENA